MPLFESETIVVDRDSDGSAMLKLDVPGRGVNVFTRAVMRDLDAACERLAREKSIPVLIVRSGKSSGFLAGADLNEFVSIRTPAEAEAMSALGQERFNKLAALPMPSIAMVHGPCLGGGLEFAMACDYRLVFDRPGTQLGLPEIELGLLPGWGGTQRLPRIVGLERALQVILTPFKRLSAREAYAIGLADALARSESELREQFDKLKMRAMHQGKVVRTRLPIRTWRQRLLESTGLGRRLVLSGAERAIRRRLPDDLPAPLEALEAVRVGVQRGFDAGLAQERSAASRLAVSPACHNLLGVFFARESARKIPAEWANLGRSDVQRVGVVGAGVMGAGIAQLAAVKGASVVVQEVDESALGAGLLRITELFQKAAERGVMSEAELQRRLAAVRGTIAWESFESVDVVVEAALERLDAKRMIFTELAARCAADTALATNTSSLSVAAIQDGIEHPERVAGLHFFNPVHRMPLVEIVRGPATGDAALATLLRWAISLGKTPVIVRDSPGFVVNRILMPYLNEAVLLVAEGLKVAQIDAAMKRFGMPMGPLELLDQIGLDIAAHVATTMEPALAGRFEPNTAFERMRANGWLGQKGGTGFYRHRGKKIVANELAENLLREGATTPASTLPLAARLVEARERMVLLMVNEAALTVQEQLASPEQIDLALVLGTGWAPHRGGPLRYGETRGLADACDALDGLARRHGKRFEPCAELRQRAQARQRFRPELASPSFGDR